MDLLKKAHIYNKVSAKNTQNLFLLIASRIKDAYPKVSDIRLRSLLRQQNLKKENHNQEMGISILSIGMTNIQKPQIFFFKLTSSEKLSPVQENTSDIIFVLLYPQTQKSLALTTLSKLSRTLKSGDFLEKLRGTEDDDSIAALFWVQEEALKAA